MRHRRRVFHVRIELLLAACRGRLTGRHGALSSLHLHHSVYVRERLTTTVLHAEQSPRYHPRFCCQAAATPTSD